MLKKAKIRIAAWGITGIMGAGCMFSGLAIQNVYAGESAEVNATETAQEDDGVPNTSPIEVPVGTDTQEAATPLEVTEERQDFSEEKTEDITDITPGSEAKTTGGVGATKETGNTYAAEAVSAKNGWVKESGGYKYYKNGKAYTGWHKMGKAEGEKNAHWSYFGKNGVIYTGWHKMGKAEGEKTAHWSYFGDNGWLRTGWVQLGKGTANPDGNVKKHWSYFGSNGWLRTGWVHFGKGTSEPDGNVAKHWSYFGNNGWLRTGWVQLGKGTSDPDGNVAKHWSYFGNNGWMRTGWVQFGKGTSEPDGNVAKHWSFFGDNGWLRTELQSMGKGTSNPDGNSAKHLSYFGSNGWLRVNQIVTVDGKKYKADGNGWLSDYNEENDVFMKYLKKIYNGANYYVNGYPRYISSGSYGVEEATTYIKYSIADFDGDGKNELVICETSGATDNSSNDRKSVYVGGSTCSTSIEYYEADSNGNVKKDSYSGRPIRFESYTIDCFNNGVIRLKMKDSPYRYMYVMFNKLIRSGIEAKKNFKNNAGNVSGYNYLLWYGTPYGVYDNEPNGYYWAVYTGGYDGWNPVSMTKSEYDKELKLLTGGKKIDVTWKDFTSANIK